MSKVIYYDVAFSFNVFYGNGRIGGKQGKIEIWSDKPINTEEMKTNDSLKNMVTGEVQSHYKKATVISLDISSINQKDNG